MLQRTHQRRDERPVSPKPMLLTERDQEIILAVYRYRLLRQDQLERLFFGTSSAAQRVLLRLYQHRYLDRRFLPTISGRSPSIYVLDRRGAQFLRMERGIDASQYPATKSLKSEFMGHTLGINDFRINVTLAAQTLGYDLERWTGEAELKANYDRVTISTPSRRTQFVSLIPDSYFVLNTPHGLSPCFLEYDRGTMTTARFGGKVRAYIAYFQTGGYERRYGTRSLRILTVCSSPRRLQNLVRTTVAAEGKSPFWFALATDLTPEAVLSAPVWQVATKSGTMSLIDPK